MRLKLWNIVLQGGPAHGEERLSAGAERPEMFLWSPPGGGDTELYTPIDDSDPARLVFAYVGNGEAEALCDLGLARRLADDYTPPPGCRVCYRLVGGPADGCSTGTRRPAGASPVIPEIEVVDARGRIHSYRFERGTDKLSQHGEAVFLYRHAGCVPAGVASGAAVAAGG
jgi:hypothetical protein